MISIGKRRECFFDNYLIDEERSTAEKRLHKPKRKNVLLVLDKPWEGKGATLFSTVYSDGLWRMYYVCNHAGGIRYVAYCESQDGISWHRPSLGIVNIDGSFDNNVILDVPMLKKFGFSGFDNMSVFYDDNPDCPVSERYKMVAWWMGHASLVMLLSQDGIHFNSSRFITDDGEFDSQNRAFYSTAHRKYFCYFRGEHTPNEGTAKIDYSYTDKTANALYDPEKFLLREPGDGTYSFMRDVRVIESRDALTWSSPRRIEYNGMDLQMYNNVIFPYPRAPHIFIGFPLRYTERGAWTKSYDELSGRENRLFRMRSLARMGLAITDGLFMSSRDGYSFVKFDEALLPPPPENPEAFVYGDGTAIPTLIEVPSDIPMADNEYMLILRENFRTKDGFNQLVGYTCRLDGFVSAHAGGEERVLVSKKFTYDGCELYANLETSARGYAVFTLRCGDEEYFSYEVFGNSVDKRIHFECEDAVARLSGKNVTLTVKMFDCDIYSIRFN